MYIYDIITSDGLFYCDRVVYRPGSSYILLVLYYFSLPQHTTLLATIHSFNKKNGRPTNQPTKNTTTTAAT